MGYTEYSTSSRSVRAEASSYFTAPISETFTQQKEQKAHSLMESRGAVLRVARDSKEHPNTVPIIIALDLTGSMGHIPHHLIKSGLPTLMSSIIQAGVKDPALLFLGVGDHEVDRYPLQVAQFESGDEELDMWLTRTYLESGGGGNEGESYGLAHYYAANHCETDAWDKRKQKGILITIGDEPSLKSYPNPAMKEVMGNGDIKTFNDVEMLAKAQEQWEVFHIYPISGYERPDTMSYWKQLLGDRFFTVKGEEEIISKSIELVLEYGSKEYIKGIHDPNDDPLDIEEIL